MSAGAGRAENTQKKLAEFAGGPQNGVKQNKITDNASKERRTPIEP
jgi:hypothetical protein